MRLPSARRSIRLCSLSIVLASVPTGARAQSTSATNPDPPIPAAVCRTGTGCAVLARQSAGRDAQGRALWVVQTAPRGTRPEDEQAARAELGCVPYAYWLLITLDGAVVEHRRILDVCNDGYGAAGVGEDEITVGPNRFTHRRSGGSNWRWGNHHELQLSPFRVVESGDDGNWVIATNQGQSSLNWESRVATASWSAPWCEPDGATPETDPTDQGNTPSFESNPFIEVVMAGNLAESGWRTDDLEGCASSYDGTPGHGFVIEGQPAPGDARFSIVATRERELFVDIRDDRIVPTRDHGRIGDSLRIWTGPSEDYMAHCLTRQSIAEPWVVDVARGRVVSGPSTIAVERVEIDGAIRLHVVLPERIAGITVGYADSDDGRTRERLVATSALGTEIATLGRTFSIGESAAICQSGGGTAELSQLPGIVEPMVN